MLQGSSVPIVRERDQAEARAERCSGQVNKWVPYRLRQKGKMQQSYVHSPLRICYFCSESYDPTTLQMYSRTKNGNKDYFPLPHILTFFRPFFCQRARTNGLALIVGLSFLHFCLTGLQPGEIMLYSFCV